MASLVARTLAPVTMGIRDINGLISRVPSDQFSEQVAQVVGAQDDIERRKKEKRDSALKQVLLTTAGGAATGGVLGALKGAILTGKPWNPAIMAGAAAVGGLGGLTISLIRRSAAKRLENEARNTVDTAPAPVSYVAGHPATKEKARDWEFARWAPLLGAEGGALIGGIGGLAAASALAKPGEQASLAPGLVGAGALGLAGLGLGYLYRKHKQTQFLEHVENELAMSQSPKAQEAAVQAEVEQDPMAKAAEAGLVEPAPVAAPRQNRKRRLLFQALGVGAVGVGAAGVGAAHLVSGSSGTDKLRNFSDTLKSWIDVKQDPRELTKQYSTLGAEALNASTLSPTELIKAYRQSPVSPTKWNAGSARHYTEFQKGPVFGYLQLAHEAADLKDNSEVANTNRAYAAAMASTYEQWRKTGKLDYPDYLLIPQIDDVGARTGRVASREHMKTYDRKLKDFPDGGRARFEEHLTKIFGELDAVRQQNAQQRSAPMRGAMKLFGADRFKPFDANELMPTLTKAMEGASLKLYGHNLLTELDHEQQKQVLYEADNTLKATDPEAWAKKQIFDAGTGVTRYASRDLYPKHVDKVLDARNTLLYGGLAVAALGGGVLLHQWLTRKKQEEKPDNIVQFPQEQLEKAAMTLVKEALITGNQWPVVATNAPMLNGRGGPPERYASAKHGARRVYDYGKGAIEAWKSTSKPLLEKHTTTSEKRAEDADPNARGEELDDVTRSIARVLEEQHGSQVKESPPPSTAVTHETAPSTSVTANPAPSTDVATDAAPSTKVAADADRSALPYRKRVEVYAMKDGKVYGGVYKDGGFGVFGGGFDDDDVVTAASREFAEETGLTVTNIRLVPVEPVKIDWNPPYKSEKQAERAKQFRGAQTFFVVADLDDSTQTAKAEGDDGKSLLRWPRLYTVAEAIGFCDKAEAGDEGVQKINAARLQVLEKLRREKVADVAQFLPRKEVLMLTPDGKLAVRRGTNRRFDLPSDVEGKPVPYEQPVHLIPDGGVPEKGVHGYQVALQSAEGDLPEGFEGVDPQDALKDLYAALGKPENRPYQSLDRARARALLRLVKKRTPQLQAVV